MVHPLVGNQYKTFDPCFQQSKVALLPSESYTVGDLKGEILSLKGLLLNRYFELISNNIYCNNNINIIITILICEFAFCVILTEACPGFNSPGKIIYIKLFSLLIKLKILYWSLTDKFSIHVDSIFVLELAFI